MNPHIALRLSLLALFTAGMAGGLWYALAAFVAASGLWAILLGLWAVACLVGALTVLCLDW